MSFRLPQALKQIKINDISSTVQRAMGRVEAEARCKLATAYRLTNYADWDALVYGHISLRIPGTDHLLINPYGMHYREITASSLVKIDLDGNLIAAGSTNFGFQKTGYVIHTALHEVRPDLSALMHIHSRAGMAVACTADDILPIHQDAMYLRPVSHHKFHGIVTDDSEKRALAADFPAPSKCMLMHGHGLMTGGRTIEEAFLYMYYLHNVCQLYVDAGYTHKPVPEDKIIPEDVIKMSMEVDEVNYDKDFGEMDFEALSRQLDYAGLETGYPYKS